jgi:integrase
MATKLTKTICDKTQADAKRDVFVWDSAISGFGLRVKPSGVKSFVAQYRIAGRSRRMVLGQYGRITVEQARKLAQKAFGAVAQGEDPLEERQAQRGGATVKELGERYLEEHARPKKKPVSVMNDEMNLKNHVYPRLGSRSVREVTREHVGKLHHSMRDTPGAANRTLALLSKMFNLAEAWGLRPDGSNPCRHVQRYRENKIERFLSADELARLGTALKAAETDESESPEAIAAIRLLVLTGCRRGEILGLRWEYVDLERRCLRLPDSKTGAKVVPLNAPALQVLDRLEKRSEWVLPGRVHGKPLNNLSKAWENITEAAKLEKLRIHDLRHAFASVGASSGQSLLIVGKLLGHSQASTTQRYAHLSQDPVAAASEAIGAKIAAAMAAKPKAEVVELRP